MSTVPRRRLDLDDDPNRPLAPITHCCETMRRQVEMRCDMHPDVFDCADALVRYNPSYGEYGLIIHDGGRSISAIDYCPWCGALLPKSERDAWFAEVEELHIDPWGESVPLDYLDGTWLAGRRSVPDS